MKRILPLLVLIPALVSLSLAKKHSAGYNLSVVGATAHSTTLGITPASQPSGVVVSSYNVFKASTSGGEVIGSPYASVTSLTPPITYVDSNVTPGATAYYTVTAVCSACSSGLTQSSFSNEVSATTPNPIGPPNAPVISATAQ